MVWLESPESQLSKTFFQIENWLNIKEVMTVYTVLCKSHKCQRLHVEKQHNIHNTQ